jgi:hypothetical protein
MVVSGGSLSCFCYIEGSSATMNDNTCCTCGKQTKSNSKFATSLESENLVSCERSRPRRGGEGRRRRLHYHIHFQHNKKRSICCKQTDTKGCCPTLFVTLLLNELNNPCGGDFLRSPTKCIHTRSLMADPKHNEFLTAPPRQ